MKYTPDEFIKKLDEQVVAQNDAKRTIAIALRNRWRRTQLNEAISKKITPKNILLIGSTGVGKTAIIRAIAELIDAPMVKVEATKYTQVGYVGESVNQMIEALADVGFTKYNKIKQAKYSNKNDYNGFLLVKKANILIKEIERLIKIELDNVYDTFFSSGVVDESLRKKEGFYFEEDIEVFNDDYLKNDNKLIDWVFGSKLLTEVLMLGLNYVPKYLTKPIKNKAKRDKLYRECVDSINDSFLGSDLLGSFFRFILYPITVPPFIEKVDFINERLFKAVLKCLEEKIDETYLVYFQSYINYIHHFLNQEPFNYDSVNESDKKDKTEVKEGANDNGAEKTETNKESEDKVNKDSIIEIGVDEKEFEDNRREILKFKDHIQYIENMGIVFIDEIDKLGESKGSGQENIGKLGVQRDLLAILDGTSVSTSRGNVKTDNILFIAAGAFHTASISDLMPELLGRLPVQVKLEDMNTVILESILRNENLSPINQYIQLLSVDNIKVKIEDDVLKTIAKVTNEINRNYRNMGARTLHLVVDKLFAAYATEVAKSEQNRIIEIGNSDVYKIKKEFSQKSFAENIKKYMELKNKVIAI